MFQLRLFASPLEHFTRLLDEGDEVDAAYSYGFQITCHRDLALSHDVWKLILPSLIGNQPDLHNACRRNDQQIILIDTLRVVFVTLNLYIDS